MLKRIYTDSLAMFCVGLVLGTAIGSIGFAALVAGSGITVLP